MWILIVSAVLIAFVILEGKRQEQKYGPCDGKGDIMRSGLLDLQRHLQADRKMEILLEEKKELPPLVTSDDPFDR